MARYPPVVSAVRVHQQIMILASAVIPTIQILAESALVLVTFRRVPPVLLILHCRMLPRPSSSSSWGLAQRQSPMWRVLRASRDRRWAILTGSHRQTSQSFSSARASTTERPTPLPPASPAFPPPWPSTLRPLALPPSLIPLRPASSPPPAQ